MAALSVAIMLTCGIIPIMTYAAPMIASVFLIPVIDMCGSSFAWMCWASVTALSMFITPDKEAVFFYCFTGFYPVIKKNFDMICPGILSTAVKFLYFAVITGLMYLLIIRLFGFEQIMQEFAQYKAIGAAALILIMTVMLVLYDRVYGRVREMYLKRIKPKLKYIFR